MEAAFGDGVASNHNPPQNRPVACFRSAAAQACRGSVVTCSHACRSVHATPSRWIVAARLKWVAAANPLQSAPGAPNGPVLFHGLNEIGAACRLEATMAANERAERPLIRANR